LKYNTDRDVMKESNIAGWSHLSQVVVQNRWENDPPSLTGHKEFLKRLNYCSTVKLV
jgi:hypothetical protein